MRLRRSNYEKPGITRQRRGKGFSYTHPDGRRVEDAAFAEARGPDPAATDNTNIGALTLAEVPQDPLQQ